MLVKNTIEDLTIEVKLATKEEGYVLANLWPLYLYDLTEFDAMPFNSHGLFEPESVKTHDYQEDLDLYWKYPDVLFPLIVRVNGQAAGFAMVGGSPGFAPKGRDYYMHDFFVLREFRGRGIAKNVAATIFDRYQGAWEVQALIKNLRAQAFWRSAAIASNKINTVTESSTQIPGDIPGTLDEKVVFQFDTKGLGKA